MANPWLSPEEEQQRAYLQQQGYVDPYSEEELATVGQPVPSITGGPQMAPDAGRAPMMAIPPYQEYQPSQRDKEHALARMFGRTASNVGRILSGISPQAGAQDTYQAAMQEPREKYIQDWRNRMYGAQLELQRQQLNPDTDDIKEYGFAVKNGYKGTFEEWMKENQPDATSSWQKNVGEYKRLFGEEPGYEDAMLLLRGPYGFQYNDVPGVMIGGRTRTAVGGGGGGGPGPASGVGTAPDGSPLPDGGSASQPPAPSSPTAGGGGIPSGFVAQQAQISRAEADKAGGIEQVKDWAIETQKLKSQATRLPDMYARVSRLQDILTDIDAGKVDSSGFPIGRWGAYYDPETAMIEAESVVGVLETLKDTDLKPISDADIAMLKNQFMSALHNPASQRKLIERGLKIIAQARQKIDSGMDYIYNKSSTGTLEGYDKYIWDQYQEQGKRDATGNNRAGSVRERWKGYEQPGAR